MERKRDGYILSTDKSLLDVDAIHHFLAAESYWAKHIPRALVERAIDHSICFGLYHGDAQVGFARVITDQATFGYLADVYVLAGHRGRGLSKWMMEMIMAHPDLQGLRRFMLATRDAHKLYAQFGFAPVANPEPLMQINHVDPYGPSAGA
ncbi:MAG TPA: GNAT family N-acetyltransferase [Dinghuibacter sp.]|uniref:GNAT family N-acetyltransferase n=1 Tax=Dinghuibacter sp. TaxID=2024697 RepID=UPI002D143418|nr:GNAT family N-acetyltransferase [Dinghuibacter sp.]HTJ13888.1 GNAT family N-acetyltransferase [Dinghuibacter sp.]